MIPGSQNSYSDILDYVNQAESAGKKIEHSIKINFLRNLTVEGIEPYLKYYNYQENIEPKITFGDYDNVNQEILDDNSHIYSQKPDIIVLSLILEQLSPDSSSVNWNADSAITILTELFNLIAKKCKALIVVNTFVPPFYSMYGITNVPKAKDKITEITKLNGFIRQFVIDNYSQFFLADWERYVRILGESESMDYRFWYTSKAPFKKSFLQLYAYDIFKIIKALKGKAKKCLILDCDNTLWGGIVGEDGLLGIKLDRNTYPGNIYYEFHQNVITLYERGVLIILCSKNNEEDVWEVFDKHPQCLLKRNHIAAWKINWDDKVTNINLLADELNLGLESFVCIDDNPVECEIISTMLPQVRVIQVPEKLYTYPRMILEEGLFDSLYLSGEDKARTKMYRAESERKNEAVKFANIEEYLASLNITTTIHEAKKHEIPRIAQLTQKTNQFNLTTKRYSEIQIESFVNDPSSSVFSLGVKDKFGDLGLTGVLIARKEGSNGIIDSYLLSCRILGRKLEVVFLRHCLSELEKKWDVKKWEAEYIATKKNRQTEDYWKNMGFGEISNKDGIKKYTSDSGKFNEQVLSYIKIND